MAVEERHILLLKVPRRVLHIPVVKLQKRLADNQRLRLAVVQKHNATRVLSASKLPGVGVETIAGGSSLARVVRAKENVRASNLN